MNTRADYAGQWVKILDQISDLESSLDRASVYNLGEAMKSYESLFDRFCPFKVGQKVKLTVAPDIPTKGHGWYGSKGFLVEGAIAEVVLRDYSNDRFGFYVKFDDDHWIDFRGNAIKTEPDRRCLFGFPEASLCAVE